MIFYLIYLLIDTKKFIHIFRLDKTVGSARNVDSGIPLLQYFAAFAGCSSESEASFKTMAFLIDKTNELELPYVIIIDGSDGSIADMICNSANSKKLTLDSCQSVSIDDIKDGTSYIAIMQKNLNVLREALN